MNRTWCGTGTSDGGLKMAKKDLRWCVDEIKALDKDLLYYEEEFELLESRVDLIESTLVSFMRNVSENLLRNPVKGKRNAKKNKT